MFESLGSTPKHDRILHNAARLLQVGGALVVLPFWLLGRRTEERLARLFRKLNLHLLNLPRHGAAVPDANDGTRRVTGVSPEPLSMDALLVELESIPRNPRRFGRHAMMLKGLPDLALFMLAQRKQTAGFGYAYPSQFRHEIVRGADDEPIAAVIATQPEPRPGLIVVHGLFSSRLFDYVRQIAVRAYFEWGFNVAAIDLRSFGHTALASAAPSTVGWKEGQDIVAVALELKRRGATSVGALGFSLGASSVMGAGRNESAAAALDGGVLAVCGPADTRVAVEHVSRPVPAGHPFRLEKFFFDRMLGIKQSDLGWDLQAADFREPVRRHMAPYYGITDDELYERSSARNFIGSTVVPTLAIHAEDDQVVPVGHAHMLAEAARDNPNVGVWILPWGGHGAFDVVDRRWTHSVYRRFFENWATIVPQREPAVDPSASTDGSSLVYSATRNGEDAARAQRSEARKQA